MEIKTKLSAIKEAKKIAAERQSDSFSVSLECDRKLLNLVKKQGLATINPKGKFNGYGYDVLPKHVVLHNSVEEQLFVDILKKYLQEKNTKIQETKDPVDLWVSRLAKLTGISLEEANEIAQEKLDYKQQQIDALEERQYESYSRQRETLINKIRRENPLRRIVDADHAFAILQASKRHNLTNYDNMLEYGRELVKEGELDACEVKDFARRHFK